MEPAVPVCGTIDLEFLSRERDTHEPVIPAIYCTGQTGVLKKIPTVIDRAWDQDFSLGGLSCPHEMNRHARSHAPISNDANLLNLQKQVEDFVREARRRDPSEPNELVSTVVDTVARDYFRHAILKQRRLASLKGAA